jgi:hypothetical protein
MSREDERTLSTADIARGAEPRQATEHARGTDTRRVSGQDLPMRDEALAALFPPEMTDDFRRRWDAIQIGFVDDPRAAVQNADELVAKVLNTLAKSFADQRAEVEGRLGQADERKTDEMRIALQRYRSFFQRLLSL